MGKSAPSTPDYRGAAEATATSDKESLAAQTYGNRINQYNPWGSLTYDSYQQWDPATQQNVTMWNQNQTFDPRIQDTLNNQMAMQQGRTQFSGDMLNRTGAALGQEMNWDKFSGYANSPQAYNSYGYNNNAPSYSPPQQQFSPYYSGGYNGYGGDISGAGGGTGQTNPPPTGGAGSGDGGSVPPPLGGGTGGGDGGVNIPISGSDIGQGGSIGGGDYGFGGGVGGDGGYSGGGIVAPFKPPEFNDGNQMMSMMSTKAASAAPPPLEDGNPYPSEEGGETPPTDGFSQYTGQDFGNVGGMYGMAQGGGGMGGDPNAVSNQGLQGIRQGGLDTPNMSNLNDIGTQYRYNDMDTSGMQTVGGAEQQRNRAESALYDRSTSRLDPQFAEEANNMEIKLRNRGLSEGDAAFDSAMDTFNRKKTDAYQTARNEAIMGGGQEASRSFGMDMANRQNQFGEGISMSQDRQSGMGQQYSQEMGRRGQMYNEAMGSSQNQMAQQGQIFGQDSALRNQFMNERNMMSESARAGQRQQYDQQMQSSNYQNSLRQMQISEEMQRRNQPLNEMNALMTGQQVSSPTFQGYSQAGRAAPTDYTGAAALEYNSALNSGNSNNMLMQGLMGGVSSMYGAGMFG